MRKQNKVAIITGASQGIGKAVAKALLIEGYSVVFTSRSEEALQKALDEVGEYRENALIVPADIADPDAVSLLFKKTIDSFGRLDFLFNNAGFSPVPTPLEDIKYEEWKAAMNTNLTGAFLCTQEAFRIMKNQTPQGGRILNNGSVAAHSPRPNHASYTASKHGITGLTKASALEGRDYNIACGQIDIGNADTELLRSHVRSASGGNANAINEVPKMSVEGVAKMIVQVADLPLNENVLFLTMLATKMPFVGRG